MRTQSNAAYLPSSGLYDVGGVQTPGGVTGRQSDANTFEQAQLTHDYDFQNQRGDTSGDARAGLCDAAIRIVAI